MYIPFTLGNVAEVAVAPINADATLSATSAGNRMIFSGIVVSQKGRPFEPLAINASNWSKVLGKPFHTSKGPFSESLRHVSEAVKGGAGVVVRVVPDDARYPVIQVSGATVKSKSKGAEHAAAPVVTKSALAFETLPQLSEGSALAVWIVDGDPSTQRSIAMSQASEAQYGANRFELVLTQTDTSGNVTQLEKFIVSLDPESVDEMGRSAFLETVLESRSQYMRSLCAPIASISNFTGFEATAFTGGTNGDLTAISNAAYSKALSVLANSIVNFTAVCSLGIYDDTTLRALADICDARRIGGYFDIDPRLTYAQATEKATSLALNRERISLYHFPYSFKDVFYGNRTLCGLSGIGFTAKANGVAKTFPIGGWHYTAAGEERAIISRSGLRAVDGIGEPDFEAMYKVRINKVNSNSAGLMFIDDSLTTYTRENYLRFEQIVSVSDAISRDFYVLANRLKHNPDGITFQGLIDGMTDILDGYVANGALVAPRDPSDGKDPYRLFVEQVDIDAWQCKWAICVTGSGRRFMGEPILVK